MNRLKIILCMLMIGTISANAQQRLQKFTKTVNANKEAKINLNTSYTNIEVETWTKDQVEVEAYIEGEKLSKEALEKELKNWIITVSGSGDEITIESKGTGNTWSEDYPDFEFNYDFEALKDLELEMANLPEIPEIPEMPEMPEIAEFPEMPEMPEMPELPELPHGIGDVNFDFEAYKKDGEKYLEQWSKEYETKYGQEYRDKMKAWGRKLGKSDFVNFSKLMEAWGENFGKAYGEKFGKDYQRQMEVWGKEFEEKWGKEYEERMEAFNERFEKQMAEREFAMEARQEAMRERQEAMVERLEHVAERRAEVARSIENKVNTKVKKTIRIKMPKKAKLNMNVRHGELKFASIIYNSRGNISHSALTASSIDGSKTSINVSYSPVLITNWNLGELKLNFVDKAQIDSVNRLVLSANSSNVDINNLTGNAAIDGSFGELAIGNIAQSFNNLNIALENSSAVLVLPKSDYNLQYKGSRSKLKHPKSKSSAATAFSIGDLSDGKTIVINAKFSEVIMQ